MLTLGTKPMLEVENLTSGYGRLMVLHEVSLSVEASEIVVLLGANGAGKTTLLRTICGILPVTSGHVRFFGEDARRLPAYQRVGKGLSHVPEGRGIFAGLSVRENLELGAFSWSKRLRSDIVDDLEMTYKLFPRLEERTNQIAGTLSGGEQQMLAIGRALMARPKLLLLDEPSLGLAPLVVRSILDTIVKLKSGGIGILLVEQNARAALSIADRGYVLSMGRVAMAGSGDALTHDVEVQNSYLGIEMSS